VPLVAAALLAWTLALLGMGAVLIRGGQRAAADLDTALAWAAKATEACAQPVEVRPFQEGG
jgi:hypothetical protein